MSLLQEEGRFYATVKDVQLGIAQTGTEFIQFNFETDDGSISGRLYFSENAFERSLEILKECFDFDGNFNDLTPIFGQECSITTEIEEYENDKGETKSSLRVKWINPKGGPKLDPQARQTLAERLTAKASGTVQTEVLDNDPF